MGTSLARMLLYRFLVRPLNVAVHYFQADHPSSNAALFRHPLPVVTTTTLEGQRKMLIEGPSATDNDRHMLRLLRIQGILNDVSRVFKLNHETTPISFNEGISQLQLETFQQRIAAIPGATDNPKFVRKWFTQLYSQQY